MRKLRSGQPLAHDEFSDVRKLYKFAIAHDSFSEISKTCEYLISGGFRSSAPGYYAMAAGIVTLYGRPFTNNSRIGMLSTSLVPVEFKELHSNLINLRHKAFAHTDASGLLPGHGMMTEVRLVFEGGSDAMEGINDHCSGTLAGQCRRRKSECQLSF